MGSALKYYANSMFRITSVGSEKYTNEEHGFEGFGAQIQFIKNRGNVDGAIIPLVYDKVKGYDSLRSSVMYAKSIGLLGGNKNGYYLGDDKDHKFRFDTIHKEFAENKELYKILYNHIVPVLEQNLSAVSPEEMEVIDEEMNY